MKVKFKVTANDIKYGRPGSPSHCPIHRALARRKPFKGKDFAVNWFGIWSDTFDKHFATIDRKSEEFILAFDAGLPVEPFEGEIQWVG